MNSTMNQGTLEDDMRRKNKLKKMDETPKHLRADDEKRGKRSSDLNKKGYFTQME